LTSLLYLLLIIDYLKICYKNVVKVSCIVTFFFPKRKKKKSIVQHSYV